MFFNKKTIYVPIGISCSVASYLRYVGLREYAFPFDWNVTPIKSAIQLINNNFEDFLKKENLIFLEQTNRLLFKENGTDLISSEEIITPVYDKKYHILLVHDFSKNAKLEYKDVKEKYYRRIDRLQELMKSDSQIIFVYDNSMINDWQFEQYKNVEYEFNLLNENEIQELKNNKFKIISFGELKRKTIIKRIIKKIYLLLKPKRVVDVD